jgi:CHAD domain-containing protein
MARSYCYSSIDAARASRFFAAVAPNLRFAQRANRNKNRFRGSKNPGASELRVSMASKASRSSAFLPADEAANAQLRLRLRAQLNLLDQNLRALERSATPAAIHATRVSARRMRVLLRVFLHAAAPGAVDRHIAVLRDLGHFLDAVREADVAQQEILHLTGGLARSAPGVAAITARTGRARARAARRLKRHLHAAAWRARFAHLHEYLRDAARGNAPHHRVGAIANKLFEKRRRRLLKALRRDTRTPFKLHRLRLKIKFMRYLCEELAWASHRSRDLQVRQLRALQACLGDLHDGWQLQQRLQSATGESEAARALSSGLAAEQRARMKEFRKRRKALLHAWREHGPR